MSNPSGSAANVHKQMCELTMQTFEPDGASVEAMRAYANCVNLIHPEHMSEGALMLAKVLFFVFVAGFVIGFVREIRDLGIGALSVDSVFSATGSALMALFVVACVMLAAACAYWIFW